MADTSVGQNTVTATHFRANWIGLFSGENQAKAIERVLRDLNRDGLVCCGLTRDLWNPFVALWWGIVSILTLGFLVKVPNVLVVAESARGTPSPTNTVMPTRIRSGWVGLFSGENQKKALERVLREINPQGLGCCAIVADRWNPFVRLWWIVVAVLSLGFYVRVPNVLIVTKPLSHNASGAPTEGAPTEAGVEHAALEPHEPAAPSELSDGGTVGDGVRAARGPDEVPRPSR